MLPDGFHDIPNDRIAAVVTSLEMRERPAARPAPDGPWTLQRLDFRVDGEAELAFFGVGSSLIGGGAARWLMNRALELAWQRPISRFWVHTCTMDHPNALGFYVRSGFVPFRRQIEVAPDPRLDGISLASRDHVPVLAQR